MVAHIDHHVEVEGQRYGLPHALVGMKLEARITDGLVEVVHRGVRVKNHVRGNVRGGFTTLEERIPASHRAHKERTPERLIRWGGEIGVHTGCLVTQLRQRFRLPEYG